MNPRYIHDFYFSLAVLDDATLQATLFSALAKLAQHLHIPKGEHFSICVSLSNSILTCGIYASADQQPHTSVKKFDAKIWYNEAQVDLAIERRDNMEIPAHTPTQLMVTNYFIYFVFPKKFEQFVLKMLNLVHL